MTARGAGARLHPMRPARITSAHLPLAVPEYRALIRWSSSGSDFLSGKYSRAHAWEFDGGLVVPASASPHHVAIAQTDPGALDPEEAFVAAISSCHMLTFLYLASHEGIPLVEYRDEASGTMAINADGAKWISIVQLRPTLVYGTPATPS